jgi:hypothetical protein
MEEKYPPGTRIKCIDPSTNVLLSGTVMDIPFKVSCGRVVNVTL